MISGVCAAVGGTPAPAITQFPPMVTGAFHPADSARLSTTAPLAALNAYRWPL
jgi:hypothetical protein